ncbi:hypothetical protein M426DRAFT_26237 [Hypoxylon sp. CI-4A]|nr:hypothetical protein M426DRAFT_26237 [Hypoxylon sp. CI-4A]
MQAHPDFSDGSSTPATSVSSYSSDAEIDTSDNMETAGNGTYDRQTGSYKYRYHNLASRGITIQLPYETPPPRISKIVDEIRNDTSDTSKTYSKITAQLPESEHEKLFIMMRVVIEMNFEDALEDDQHTWLFLYDEGIIRGLDHLFTTGALTGFLAERYGLARPAPDLTLGYVLGEAIYSEKAQHVLKPWYDTVGIGDASVKPLYRPYLIVEQKTAGGNLYFAQNQCMTDTAAALYLNDPVFTNADENIVYSMALNDSQVKLNIGWVEEGIVEGKTVCSWKTSK